MSEKSHAANIKDIMKYLNQTLELLEGYVPNEDFSDANSDVYKLFVTLFGIYSRPQTSLIVPKIENLGISEAALDTTNIIAQRLTKQITEPKAAEIAPVINRDHQKHAHTQNLRRNSVLSVLNSDAVAKRFHRENIRQIMKDDTDAPIMNIVGMDISLEEQFQANLRSIEESVHKSHNLDPETVEEDEADTYQTLHNQIFISRKQAIAPALSKSRKVDISETKTADIDAKLRRVKKLLKNSKLVTKAQRKDVG